MSLHLYCKDLFAMKKCLDINDLAEYADYLLYGAEMPENKILTHVQHCFLCKQEIMEVCNQMDKMQLVIVHPDRDL